MYISQKVYIGVLIGFKAIITKGGSAKLILGLSTLFFTINKGFKSAKTVEIYHFNNIKNMRVFNVLTQKS